MMRSLLLAVLAEGLAQSVLASPAAPLITTPPMGFNNWARFECDLNQTLFTETADAMVAKGLLKAGFDRLNLDDCWLLHTRAANGSLQWDPTKFPKGLIWLSDYLHERGFHFGIYEDAGTETCGGYPGTLGHETQDAYTFASWGIDYLKLDGCNVPTKKGLTEEETYKEIYHKWHTVLSAMPEPLIFSESAPAYFAGEPKLKNWYTVMDWVPSNGQLARHSYDIAVYPGPNTWESIMTNYGQEVRLARYQKIGYYNDPDFIIPDWPDLTIHEKMSHFALWSSFSAPLIISAYIPGLNDQEISYLTNSEVISVDQDALGFQATLVSQDGTWDVLTKSLSNGDRLLTVLNLGNDTGSYTVPIERLGVTSNRRSVYDVKDLWTGAVTQASSAIQAKDVPSHGTAIFRISKKGGSCEVTPTGMIFNTASLACMEGSAKPAVSNATCNGADSQVWQVRADGTISSLAGGSKCLTEGSGGAVTMATCSGHAMKSQQWTYYLTGNVINAESHKCLTETGPGSLVTKACEDEANDQVFGLPSGVEVHQGGPM